MSFHRPLVALSLGVGLLLAGAARGQPAGNLSSLHDALRLGPAQEAGWMLYRGSVESSARAQQRRQAAATLMPTLSAPRRMDLVEAELQQELADVRVQATAIKTFYATLTPEQQRVFDAQTLPPPESRGGGEAR